MNGPRDASSARLVGTMGLAGLLSGLVLVGVFVATRPAIQRNKAEALQSAIFHVLPGTEQTRTLVLRGDALVPYDGPSGVEPTEPAIYVGLDTGGRLVGYAIPADGSGFMDTIRLLYGFDTRRRVVVGLKILDSRETPGLGDKIESDTRFLENFRALAVEPSLTAVKRGQKTAPNQVDCITGATISSEAVVGILQRSTQRWLPLLGRPDAEGEGDGDAE